ncbi:MAG TPA: FAD-dependent oxidoreductase [Novosphingobium sp.]|nr:FAD-dependent oxidoreductase [Novosphingobium sp.]
MALTHAHLPIKLGNVEIRNRIFRSAHGTNLGQGTISEDLIAFHEARARGGMGLTIQEVMQVHPSGPGIINPDYPGIGEAFQRMMDRLRPLGMALFQQLYHGGANGLPRDGTPPWAPSDVPTPSAGVVPIPMTRAMIEDIVTGFARTAAKCEAWGAQGVEIHGAHGYLIQQFLSPATNLREDEYGGGFENRIRFMVEILTEVRASVSPGYPVGVRLSPDLVPGGFDVVQNQMLVRVLEDKGLIDFVDLSISNHQNTAKIFGGMHEPAGYELATSVPIARAATVPSLVIGRFRTMEEADAVIREGDADMVGMSRATIAEPALVAKTLAGDPLSVRPCIGCNQGCIGGLMSAARRLGCTINPAVGFEVSLGEDKFVPAEAPRKVLVVGGGPAGMEAARVAATRGHKVTLWEARPYLGGAIRLAAKAPTRAGIADFTFWQEQELEKLGVEIDLNRYAEADDVLAEAPDALVVATGSMARMDGIQVSNPTEPIVGHEKRHVISTEELFGGDRDFGRTAVVIDDVGHYEAIAACEYLISRGVAVTYVSRLPSLGIQLEPAAMPEPALQRLRRGDFTMQLRMRAVSIEEGSVTISPLGPSRQNVPLTTVAADTVVLVTYNRANRELYNEIEGSGMPVYLVGDAQSPRYLNAAVREGYLAGLAI